MILGILEDALAILFLFAGILYYLHYGWFEKYVLIVSNVLLYIAGLFWGLVLLSPRFVLGILKTTIIAIATVFLILVYSATFVVPLVGERATEWRSSLRSNLGVYYAASQVREMRGIMVRIVAEEDERSPQFEDPEEYRSEFERVREEAKTKLEGGETVLSILLGALLLMSKLVGFELFQASIHGIRMDLMIEAWVLVIAVSIVYRSSILDFLAYSSEDEFDSLDEMDVALRYQKGVSLVGFIQGLMFLLVLVAAITKVNHRLTEEVLRAHYTNEPWLASTWNKLNN